MEHSKVAGLVLVKPRPGTSKNVCFITIEDETGNANVVVFQNKFKCYRKEILHAKLLMVSGKLQKEGEVIHVVAQQLFDLSNLLNRLDKIRHAGQQQKSNRKIIQGKYSREGVILNKKMAVSIAFLFFSLNSTLFLRGGGGVELFFCRKHTINHTKGMVTH